NGKGYPHGLKEDQISDNAKIATIADVYDALTTNRPYGGARRPISALTLMKEEMVGHFEQKRFEEFILFLGGRSA
ncbi:MAG: HD-GYP domain-containing protein, partial [Desulfurivibrionaceae bacterium]